MKKVVLVIGDLARRDTAFLPKVLNEHYEVLAASTSIPVQNISPLLKGDCRQIDLLDYSSYSDLIEKERLTKIFFFSLEDAQQVVLNSIAKEKGVRTYHVEHGLRDPETNDRTATWIVTHLPKITDRHPKKLYSLTRRIRMRLLRIKSLRELPADVSREAKAYFKHYNPFEMGKTIREFNGKVHLPDVYISFSPAVFEFHRNEFFPNEQEVHFIGNPAFDPISHLHPSPDGKRKLFFIDQPFVEQRLFGWTREFKESLIRNLASISIATTGDKLRVKPHPRSEMAFWKSFGEEITLIDSDEMHADGIYLGFGSTLLILLASQGESAVISLEIHPDIDFKYSKFLTRSGAIEEVESLDHLRRILLNISELVLDQKKFKNEFTTRWVFSADGKATERLRKVVLES